MINLRNDGKRTYQTIEGDHRPGKIKTYSDGLGQSLKDRHPEELKETKDAADETSPSRVPGASKKAAVEQAKGGKRNGKPAPKKADAGKPASEPVEGDDDAEGDDKS